MECTVVTQVRGDKNLNYNDRGNEEKGLDFSNFRDQSINQSINKNKACYSEGGHYSIDDSLMSLN